MMSAKDVVEVRAWAEKLRANLPASVDAASLGVTSKAPFQLLCVREGLIWRSEELARSACDALERDDLAAAAILTRGVTENAALTWMLLDVLEKRANYTSQQLSDKLVRMLVGSKLWEDMPSPVHVLDCLRTMDKTVSGVFRSYEQLCEIAHPNWAGVAALYSKNDQPNFTVNFGRSLRPVDGTRDMIINALLGSLGGFEYAYNQIGNLMPAFLAELESFWPDEVNK